MPECCLIVVAHPDDETIGAGIWMHRNANLEIHILHVTDGSPRDMQDARAAGFTSCDAYASTRRRELYEALALIGIPAIRCHAFDCPDKEAYRHFTDLLDRTDRLITSLRPELVLSHCYEGGHPDHDAAAFIVSVIRQRRKSFEHREFPLYHAQPDGEMCTSEFLPGVGLDSLDVLELSPHEQELKQRMIACFGTQQGILQNFKSRFERFRKAPTYDFTQPPHPGPLLYERWGWEISGEEWRRQAANAV